MKSKMFIITIFLACIVMTFTISCKKNNNLQKSVTNKELSADDIKVLRLVDKFKKDLKSELKDGEEMGIDSAIWYLETTLNVTYARSDSTTPTYYTDTILVTIPISENQTILKSDVDNAYSVLVDSLRNHYLKLNFNEKSILLVDLDIFAQNSQNLTVRMMSIMGTNEYHPFPTFQDLDNWIWGRHEGKCDGTNLGLDAADMLKQYANQFPKYPMNCYTGIETTSWIYPGDPLTGTGNNPYGFANTLLFKVEVPYPNPNPEICLTYDMMNYYLACLKTLANNYTPANKEIIYYSCKWTYIGGWNYTDEVHDARFTYGHAIGVPFPPIIFYN